MARRWTIWHKLLPPGLILFVLGQIAVYSGATVKDDAAIVWMGAIAAILGPLLIVISIVGSSVTGWRERLPRRTR